MTPKDRARLAASGKRLAESAKRRDLRRFIPATSGEQGLVSPGHLADYMDALVAADSSPQRLVISTPPRHGKSETTLHNIVRVLSNKPTARIAYATYAQAFSRRQSTHAMRIAKRTGIEFVEESQDFWRTKDDGFVLWTSIGGPFTGLGVDLLIIDDPVKDRVEAESAVYRNRAWDWFTSVAFTRLEPGASAFVIQTRWHPDDLAGRLIGEGWNRINLAAVDEDGTPLWANRYGVAALEEIRRTVGEYDWSALYMGQPRSRGDSVFGEPAYYDELPKSGYRVSIGADFAYTAKNYSDFSCAVVLYHANGVSYVADVVRQRVAAPRFKQSLIRLRNDHRGRITAFVGGTEVGVVDFLKQSDRDGVADALGITAIPAKGDKFSRAQPVAAAWNAGSVLLPKKADWLDPFVSELTSFTGVKDPHDDQVDALTGAFHPFTVQVPRRSIAALPPG